MRKDWKQLVREAEKKGWTVTKTGSNHLKWTAPDGQVVFSPGTASDKRGYHNHMSQLRKHGW